MRRAQLGPFVEARPEGREASASGLADKVRVRYGRKRGQRELAHAASSLGARYAKRLGDVLRLDLGRVRQRRRGSSDACHPRPPSRRQRQPLDRPPEELVGRTRASRHRVVQPLACRDHAFPHDGRGLGATGSELGRSRARHGHDEVEAVEQRPRELVAKGRQALRRACALGSRVAAARARAQVHGRDELKPGREDREAGGPRDRDAAVLEWLAQRLERGALELGQLVQEEHAPVREARLSRPRPGPAADDRGHRRAVVRRAEGRPRDQRPLGRQEPGDRVDAGHLELVARLQRRQDRREAAAEHRLPGSRRACQQQVVTSGRRELERAARPFLAAHVRQVGRIRLDPLRRRVDRRRPELAAEVRDRLGEVPDRDGLDAAELGLGRGLGCAEDPIEPGQPGALGDREGAANRPDAPVERELADRGVLREPFGRHLAGGCEQREPDREVEAGALLPQARRREVDRDPPQRPLELGGGDAAADAMLRLRAGTVGEARRWRRTARRSADAPRPRHASPRARPERG